MFFFLDFSRCNYSDQLVRIYLLSFLDLEFFKFSTYRSQDLSLHLHSFHVQSGEGGEEACIREVKEELGVDVTPDQLILIKRIVRAAGEHMIWDLFLVRYNTQKRRFKLAPDEVAEVRWLTPDQLRKMIKEEMIFYYPEMFDVIAKIEDMAFC